MEAVAEKVGGNIKEEEVMLPGFRFHPTDEELVGFYLRKKVEKKPIRIELIKHIDIYKYDPWDLPRESSLGIKEWYFFCIRGRKYRNSIRPNRVTGSGFWKATGIDKPINSVKEPHECIGLKKSLVYYRGSAGKGTKTDWMMHEFRLPPNINRKLANHSCNATLLQTKADTFQEAEVWTLCRIFKRIPSYKKYISTPSVMKEATTITTTALTDSACSKTCSLESDNREPYLTFEDSNIQEIIDTKPINIVEHEQQRQQLDINETSHLFFGQRWSSLIDQTNYCSFAASNYHWSPIEVDHHDHDHYHDVFASGNWDELTSVVQLAINPSKTL